MNTLEDLLIAIAEKGLRIRILSEREVRVMPHLPTPTRWEWWCELMHANGWRDADFGGSMFSAISNAFERAKGNRGPESRPMNSGVLAPVKPAAKAPPEEIEIDMDDLIGGPASKPTPKKANQIDLDDLI